ncbi:TonB-dependent siderophore receptor [uncultured Pleomorphomonas sp.]|uniref:TonB-dependent siderophore receptor n=1 Tax=uncultured Pleomorphomonas sp. TaxID=442121 RepID=A0A212LEP0_9HYPH|nr:TonB-dependent siderophore receptor [uncultured Pleomorphomonas sp.]SCM76024.1 TonB-dependent siderophore receptor [uncultured Pleomorphomonas sp.]
MDTATTAGNTRQKSPLRCRTAVLLGCSALMAAAPVSLRAQQNDTAKTADDATVLETITVEGAGSGDDSKTIVATKTTGGGKMPTDILETPAAVSVITAKEIQERGADSVEQVLQYTAGVSTDYYGSDDRFDYFQIRGFDTYTYRDGLVIGSPFGGLREEPYAFERVEVLKGASSTGFGVSDPGGSVNYVTKRPKSERFGEVYGTGGSFSHKEAGFDFGDNITEDDTLSYRLTGKLQRSNAEYDYSQDDENFIMGGLTWRPTDATSVSVVFDHLDKDGTPGSGGHPEGSDFSRDRFFGEPDYNYRDIDRDSVSIMLDHAFGNGLTFNTNARYSKTHTNFGYAYIYEPNALANGDTIADRYYYGNDGSSEQFIVDSHLLYETRFNNMNSRTLVGLEYNKFKSDSTTDYGVAPGIDWENPVYSGAPDSVPFYSSTKNDQKTKAIYLQQDLTVFDKLTATVGLRNDWLDIETEGLNAYTGASSGEDSLSEFTKRFGLTYKITGELAAYASYAESVAPPSVGTEPETGKQYEVGIKYRPDAFPALFSAAIYDLTKENITVTDPVTYTQSTVGKIRHRGIDLEAKAEVTDNINLIAAYSYIDSEIVENAGTNEGNRLGLVPEHLASLWGTYTLEGDGSRGDMTFGLGARYMGSYYFTDANAKKSDGAVVFDASFTYNIQENTTFQLNVSNLFDEKHVAYGGYGADWYNPGRSIMATLRQTW